MAGLRGETIGTAFVRILADGSGLPESVKREMGKAEPAVHTTGDDTSEEFWKGFSENTDRNDEFVKSLDKKLSDVKGRMHANADFIGEDFQKTISDHVVDMLGGDQFDANAREIGDRVARNVVEGMNKSDVLPDNFFREIAKAVEEISKESQAFDELEKSAHAANEAFDAKEMTKDSRAMVTELRKMSAELDKQEREYQTLHRLGEQMLADLHNSEDAAHRMNEAFDAKQMSKDSQAMVTELRKMHAQLVENQRAFDQDEAAAHRMNQAFDKKAVDEFSNALDELVRRHKRLDGARKKNGDSAKDLTRDFKDLRIAAHDSDAVMAALGKRLLDLAEKFDPPGRNANSFVDRMRNVNKVIARGSGAGSRNDFLNIIGKMNGALAGTGIIAAKGTIGLGKLVGKIPGVKKGVSAVGDLFLNAAGNIGEFAGKINETISGWGKIGSIVSQGASKVGSGIGNMVLGLAGALPEIGAVVAALAAAVPLIAVFVAAVSSAVAGAVAVLGSVSFAAIGAITPLLPLILPLAAGIGVLALAFMGLSKAQKKALSVDLKPLSNEFKALRATAQEGLFGKGDKNIKTLAADLGPVLATLKPLFKNTGQAIADVAISFTKAMNTPGFKGFINVLGKFIPDAIRKLGGITKGLGKGLGGIFQAAIPFAQKFLDWFGKVADKFGNFTTSKKGQSWLHDFFQKGLDSLKAVWPLIKNVADLIGTLLGSGKKEGDSIITSLADNVKQFTDMIKKNPDTLKNWFKSGKDTFKQIGDIFKAVGKLIDFLDSPGTRTAAIVLFQTIKIAVILLKPIIEALMQPIVQTVKMVVLLWRAFKFLWEQAKKLGPVFKDIWNWLKKVWDKMKDLASVIKDKVVKAWDDLKDAVGKFKDFIKNLPQTVVDAIVSGFKKAKDWVTGTFIPFIQGLPNDFAAGLGAIVGTVFGLLWGGFQKAKDFILNTFIPFIQGIPGQVEAFFKAAPGAIKDFFVNAFNTAKAWVENTMLPWIAALPGKVGNFFKGAWNFIKDFFVGAWNSAKNWVTGTMLPWIKGLPGRISGSIVKSGTFIKDFFVNSWKKVTDWWTNTAWPWIKGLPDKIASGFSNLGSSIATGIKDTLNSMVNHVIDAINSFIRNFNKFNGPAPDIPLLKRLAHGGLVDTATLAVVGERGREAVVPLDMPLSKVDPAVRELAKAARGLPNDLAGTQPGPNKIINVGGLTVVTPTQDPAAVAQETVNKLVGAAYI